MTAPLDLDQLKTFIAISETGNFTRAAEMVFRTQSAVSMQMRRLEECIGQSLFEKDGRNNRLTPDGERLLTYARRMLDLNNETLAAFDENRLEGHIRVGMPDDYAEPFLPEIIARFSRSNSRVEMSIVCEPSRNMVDYIQQGSLDLALVINQYPSEIIRREPLLWVGSANHDTHLRSTLPVALGRPTCNRRQSACAALETVGRDYRIMFTSFSATAIAAAVLSGSAISAMPECALRPGMRILGKANGFPNLPECQIGLIRGTTGQPEIIDALALHISDSLDNISSVGITRLVNTATA